LVFAAASLSEALQAVGNDFEHTTGQPVRCSFASSGQLARQIAAGAPADIFVSADDVAMNDVEKAGLLAQGTRRPFVSNHLVVVVPAGTTNPPTRPEDLARLSRISIGDPETVPAGRYARQWLESLGLWESAASHALRALDVRAVLATVEAGAADAGIVYRTDALSSKKVRVAFEASGPSSPHVVYPVALLAHSTNPGARRFLSYLFEPSARALVAAQGFEPPPSP
jgi:molybdate transport system substrate-binding protein